jgi:hypothetical protein
MPRPYSRVDTYRTPIIERDHGYNDDPHEPPDDSGPPRVSGRSYARNIFQAPVDPRHWSYFSRRQAKYDQAREHYVHNFKALNPATRRMEPYPLPYNYMKFMSRLPQFVQDQIIFDRLALVEVQAAERRIEEARKQAAADEQRRKLVTETMPLAEKVKMGQKGGMFYSFGSTPPHLMSTADLLRTHYSVNPQDRKLEINRELQRRQVYDPEGLAIKWGII